MKRLMVLILSVVMALSSFSIASAEDKTDNQVIIDQDTAVTIGMIFVANLTKDMDWDNHTQIDKVIPLHSYDGEVSYYYIGLKSFGENKGYVIVSTSLDEPLIAEFSDEGDLTINGEGESEEDCIFIRELSENDVAYYDTLVCSYDPVKIQKISKVDNMSISPDDYRDIAISLVNDIQEQELDLSSGRSYITDPVAYLNSHYSGYTYSFISSHTVESTFPGYVINVNNGCTVFGTAAIMKYYLGSNYTYTNVVNKCKNIAVSNNYATTSNYYISISNTVPFVQKCINNYHLGKTATNSYLLSSARTEINNDRPCLINIATSEYYSDHTVSAFGYKRYKVTRTSNNQSRTLTFYKIKDGYTSASRYVCDDSIVGVFVTKVN